MRASAPLPWAGIRKPGRWRQTTQPAGASVHHRDEFNPDLAPRFGSLFLKVQQEAHRAKPKSTATLDANTKLARAEGGVQKKRVVGGGGGKGDGLEIDQCLARWQEGISSHRPQACALIRRSGRMLGTRNSAYAEHEKKSTSSRMKDSSKGEKLTRHCSLCAVSPLPRCHIFDLPYPDIHESSAVAG